MPRLQANPARVGAKRRGHEQAHLSDAERQGKVRVESGHLSRCGQRLCGRRAQDPPLSGSGVVAIGPGNGEPK